MTDAPVTPLVTRSHERGITTLTLDSPHNRNALSARLVAALHQALADAAADDGTRAVVLTHTGTTFCAGADLSEATTGAAKDGPLELARLLRAIVALPRPVVARVTGHVRAGGLGLLGACDIAVAGPAATFAFTEARLGLAPAVISLPLLPRIDARAAGRYYLTGEKFGPAEAARIGLVTLAADDVDAGLAPVLDGCARAPPRGSRPRRGWSPRRCWPPSTATRTRWRRSPRGSSAPPRPAGMTAFLERRAPVWAR
ncbi:enoyl-CoA hydratase family protein [Streptomyces endophytica]|uniref:Enoyl-CoA hydratase family protein n=1 Tax=Streptomyces endophytica TaxID=2991496 RepID=A0ABY6P856_9ACTN|nr:enoyl-CoA hydratase family protein [Streptomyces endophytica]UZJ29999.1 enoyl-CoA hydratase family protein [Streptomyces endophytica]